MALSDVRDILVIGILAGGAYLAYDWYNKYMIPLYVHEDFSGVQKQDVYIPSPDTAYPGHELHDTFGDPVYDAGWDYMGTMRANTNDYFNMQGWDYWIP